MAMIAGDGATTHATDHDEAEPQEDGETTAAQQLEEPAPTVLTHDSQPPAATDDGTTGLVLPEGQTTTVPAGSRIILGGDTTLRVDSGSVTVVGAGACISNAPVVINVGGAVNTLSTCHAGATVVPAETRLTTVSSPIAVSQYRHSRVEVQLVIGSATTVADSRLAEVTTPAHEAATATVGVAAASVTNVQGTVTIAQ